MFYSEEFQEEALTSEYAGCCEVNVRRRNLREKQERERKRERNKRVSEKGEEVGGAASFLRAGRSFHACSAGSEARVHPEPPRLFTVTSGGAADKQAARGIFDFFF